MKNTIKLVTGIFILLIMASSIFAYGGNGMMTKGKSYGKNQGGQVYQVYDDTQVNHQSEVSSLPMEELSKEEIDGLLLMREEEKLARDVYYTLDKTWGLQIFSNIASSEQTHTDAIKSLLDKYDLEDPMSTDEFGNFENSDLQNLYHSLVEQGSNSLLDALIVGATVEDLDIKDLQELNEIADNQDITAVYNNLEKGSRNHLRSFTKMIELNGGIYEPQFITQEEYDSIINSDMERGTQYDANGKASQINGMMNRDSNTELKGYDQVNSRNGQNSDFAQNQNQIKNQEYVQNKEQNRSLFAKMWGSIRGFFN